MGTLIALRICGATNTSDYLYSANNKSETIVTIVKVSNNKTQETLPASLYRGIKLSREELKSLLKEAFTQYGIADQIPLAERTIACESSWDIYASNGISFGIAQFTPATWKEFGYGDIYNPLVQFQTMAKLWAKGEQNRWDCYRNLSK